MVGARRPETRWVTRLIPLFLGGCVGFSTYVFVKRICVDFYIENRHESHVATAFLSVYFVSFFLMLLTYFRVFLVIQFDPGVVPLGPLAVEQKKKEKERRRSSGCCGRSVDDLEANRYEGYWPDPSVDSPGLERFYSKDVFICYTDGRPRWCSSCSNWKQDRVSHCSEIDRCVKKMDHYCPWVGGIVGETSFKFFVQFTFYTAIYCTVALVAAGMSLRESLQEEVTVDGFVIGLLVIAGFFGIFTFAMTATSVQYICVNLTNVDYLKAQTLVHQLAIRVPRGTPPGPDYGVITYPLPKPQPSPTSPQSSGRTAVSEPVSSRDLLAQRTFAVVRTEKGENPFDIGVYRNWKSVMGNNIIDWFLPFNRSPCESFENSESFYEMGPLIQELRARFSLPEIPPNEKGGLELSELNGRGKRDGDGML
ncbi:DHHC palmitoyltransferase-domain-containing protein [Cercophora newfieldiana]|uniref:Palmitoyltransferase n=1 Tax=Cercophora newfieldiana TaxID=92897 RepID=A0AA39YME0_9PEZI|nr:DHHC palmitoyltransferase-domain-containing protein [Cercophora newfieldiana]